MNEGVDLPAVSVFEQVKSAVSIETYFSDVLKRDLVMEGATMMACRCPWHQEKTPSLKIWVDEGRFHCFGACDFGGSIIDAVIRQENLTYPMEAVEWLNDYYKLDLDLQNNNYKEFKTKVDKAQKQLVKDQAEMLDPKSKVAAQARALLKQRGLSEETWKYFQLSVNKQQARLRIPIIEKGGHPIAITGRALLSTMDCPQCGEKVKALDVYTQKKRNHNQEKHDGHLRFCTQKSCHKAASTCPHCQKEGIWAGLAEQEPKYLNQEGYTKSQNLYNFHQASIELRGQKELKDRQPFLVMEGFGDVWACYEAGYVGGVAYNGASISPAQAQLLSKKIEEFYKASEARPGVNGPDDLRWIGLIPDMDSTGRSRNYKNIETITQTNPDIVLKVLYGLDQFKKDNGEDCKDIGEVLEYHGKEKTQQMLDNNWVSADEYKIRDIIDANWGDKRKEIELISKVLASARHTIHLDNLVPLLSEHWAVEDKVVRNFIHTSKNESTEVSNNAQIIATMPEAQKAAEEYLKSGFVIKTDYDVLNKHLPGGGFRLKQLSLVLGKSQPLDSNILTPKGWVKMGELRLGDKVVNPEGGEAEITDIFPQGNRDIYRITLSDQRTVECDIEHLWPIQYQGKAFTKTLKQIMQESDWRKDKIFIPVLKEHEMVIDKYITNIELIGKREAQCIRLNSQNKLYVTDNNIVTHNSGTGKTTLITNLLWQFLREQKLPCVFFSLEQPKAQVYLGLTQIALNISAPEAEELVKTNSPKLEEVNKIFENLTIVDNVPDGDEILEMSPGRIKSLIDEINLTRTGMGETIKVVAIDHLGILKPGSQAPPNARKDENSVTAYVMERLFSIAKETNTFFMVLQQLPKEVPPGEEFSYDAGRGASQQTDFSDYIFCIWRPDQLKGLSEEEKVSLEGQYKLKLGKNRHGGNNITAHLIFDHEKRRISNESGFGLPAGFMPDSESVDLLDVPDTGVPEGLFETQPDEEQNMPLPDYYE